ncbi:AAA family ATPase [Vibrio fluvialis]|nr:hypothetical protein [Vibrio fluvialis]MBY8142101.1 hypothetical protein [Vibrio fluvialis]
MEQSNQPQDLIKLPLLKAVNLDGFAIYKKRNGRVNLDINKSVYCLAGANGLGKSTLLTAIIFGLCGFLRKRTQERIAQEKRRPSGEKYAKEYFEGRVGEADKSGAKISLKFRIGKYLYSLQRAIFTKGIEDLVIVDTESDTVIYNNDGQSAKKKLEDYESNIANHTRLKSFDRFAFLIQHVLAFDEEHHLLFWDKEALEDALFTCIGLDPQLTGLAVSLRNELSKIDSKRRNLQYAKSQMEKVLRASQQFYENVDDIVIDKELLRSLQDELDNLKQEQKDKQSEIDTENSLLAQHTHQKMLLEREYQSLFEKMTANNVAIPFELELKQSVESQKCFCCGSKESTAISTIKSKLEENQCAICGSDVAEGGFEKLDELSNELAKLDSYIAEINSKIKNSSMKIERLMKEVNEISEEEKKVVVNITHLCPSSELAAQALDGSSPISSMKSKLEAFDEKRVALDQDKNRISKDYNQCLKELESKYLLIENQFVPLFKKLAEQFIGMQVSISLVRPKSPNSKKSMLEIAIEGASRLVEHQLSESQRFFIDIALKMSLIQFCTGESENVSMLLDTPEGSLDIAYESKVGEMFALFIKHNKSLFITANLNSSELLKRLALKCTKEQMHLERMIDWADLSSVQKQEEDLFNRAYSDILTYLEGNTHA